jgi:hypothetical protein
VFLNLSELTAGMFTVVFGVSTKEVASMGNDRAMRDQID